MLLYWFKISIRLLGIENFITIHHRHKVLGLGEIDDIVSIAGEHVNGFYLVARDFKVEDLIGAYLSLLDEALTANYDEEFPLGVVPVLALSDARLGDVDADLSAVKGVDELGKGASRVNIHLQGEGYFFLGQVTQVGAVELLGKGAFWNLRYQESLWLV